MKDYIFACGTVYNVALCLHHASFVLASIIYMAGMPFANYAADWGLLVKAVGLCTILTPAVIYVISPAKYLIWNVLYRSALLVYLVAFHWQVYHSKLYIMLCADLLFILAICIRLACSAADRQLMMAIFNIRKPITFAPSEMKDPQLIDEYYYHICTKKDAYGRLIRLTTGVCTDNHVCIGYLNENRDDYEQVDAFMQWVISNKKKKDGKPHDA